MGLQRKSQLCHRLIGLPFLFLTCMSTMYTPTPARPMLRSSGLGGVGSSAPGISCATGSSQGVENICSTMTSCVFGPAAARKCFNMMRQHSSDQSCSTCETRKTETSSCRAGCGVKKSWPWEPKRQLCRHGDGHGGPTLNQRTLERHAARFDCLGHILLPVLCVKLYCRELTTL